MYGACIHMIKLGGSEMRFVNTKQNPHSLDVMLHKHASTLPSSPSKQATRSNTQTDNYRETKKPSKFKGEEKDSLDTQSSSHQQPSVLSSLSHYNGNTIKGNHESELLLSMTDNRPVCRERRGAPMV